MILFADWLFLFVVNIFCQQRTFELISKSNEKFLKEEWQKMHEMIILNRKKEGSLVFDEYWALDTMGDFLSLDHMQKIMSDFMLTDRTAQLEFTQIMSLLDKPEDVDSRLITLFYQDLMSYLRVPTLSAEIQRHAMKYYPHIKSSTACYFCWTCIVISIAVMMRDVIGFGNRHNNYVQLLWLVISILTLFIDFLINSLFVFTVHVAMPSLCFDEIFQVKSKFATLVKSPEVAKNKTGIVNAPSLFFVSFRLAQLLPDLQISKIIIKFRSAFPKFNYSKGIESNLFNLWGFINAFVQLPILFQDAIFHFFIYVIFVLISVFCLWIAKFNRALVIFPFVVLMALFLYWVSNLLAVNNLTGKVSLSGQKLKPNQASFSKDIIDTENKFGSKIPLHEYDW